MNFKELRSGSVSTFLVRLIVFGIGLGFKIALARELSLEDNGVFGKWLASFNYGVILFGFGLAQSLVYFKRKGINAKTLLRTNIISYSFFFIVGIIIALALRIDFFYISLFVAVFLGVLLSSINSLFVSFDQILKFNKTEFLKALLTICTVLVSLFFVFNQVESGLEYLYLSYTVGLLVTILIVFPRNFIVEKNTYFKKKYFRYGLNSFFMNALGSSLYVVDIFLVEAFLGKEALGLYVVAGSVARILWFVIDAIGVVIFPKMVNNSESDAWKVKQALYGISFFCLIINLLAVVIYLLIGPDLIILTFGVKYSSIFNVLLILLLASHGSVLYKLVNRYLAAQDKWKVSIYSLLVAVIVNVALNIWLLPTIGLIGAGIASLISYWICGVMIVRMSSLDLQAFLFGFKHFKSIATKN
jgi:O-antigen/teichoic acid export membrane protein